MTNRLQLSAAGQHENSGSTVRSFLSRYRGTIVQYAGFLLVVVLFSVLTGGEIFSAYNIKTLIGQTSPLIIVCAGVMFIFANGSVDIASGAVTGLCALATALILNSTGSLLLALTVSVVISVGMYLFSTVVSIRFRLIFTIASLAVMFMARGVVTYVCSLTSNSIISMANYDMIKGFKNDTVLQILMTAAAVLVCWILFSFTKIGKQSMALGDNAVSAQQSGVKADKIKLICAVIAGICVGIASIFSLARAGSVSKNIGSGMEMDVMVALILGGMSLSGGSKSKFSAAIIGPITFRLLSNGMTMAGVPNGYVSLIRGLIFLIIVFVTLRQNKDIREMPR